MAVGVTVAAAVLLAPVVRKPIKITRAGVSGYSATKFLIPGITNRGIKWCSRKQI